MCSLGLSEKITEQVNFFDRILAFKVFVYHLFQVNELSPWRMHTDYT